MTADKYEAGWMDCILADLVIVEKTEIKIQLFAKNLQDPLLNEQYL